MRTTETFGTPDNPTGMLSIYGGRPGHLKEQEGAPLAVWETYVAEITTTVEALDKLIPAPLQRVDGRPVVYLAHLEATTWRGWDGINKPYTEIGLWVPVQYAGRVGISLFHLYLDGPGASQATIATREQFGVTKSIATIDASFNADWTEMWSTVVEYGRPRMYMHGKYSEEVDPSTSPMRLTSSMLSVKEIPNADFTGYDVRKVIHCDWSHNNGSQTPDLRVLKGTAEIQLWEPFDAFPIVESGPSWYYRAQRQEFLPFLRSGEVLADLLEHP